MEKIKRLNIFQLSRELACIHFQLRAKLSHSSLAANETLLLEKGYEEGTDGLVWSGEPHEQPFVLVQRLSVFLATCHSAIAYMFCCIDLCVEPVLTFLAHLFTSVL